MALALPRAVAALERGIEEGLHYGAQLSVVHAGRQADLCVGQAARDVPMTADHVLCWSSSVKPLLSLALGRLYDRALVRFSDPVAQHLPAFAARGKAGVTLEHCLTHTAGLWGAMRGSGPECSPARHVEHICRQPLAEGWVPGRRCGYDSGAWYVGAGVVTAADPASRPYERFVEEELFAPLGISSSSVGMSEDRFAALERDGLLAPIYDMSKRGLAEGWRRVPRDEEPEMVRYPCPAGNGRGPARDLASLYAALLPGGEEGAGGAAPTGAWQPDEPGMECDAAPSEEPAASSALLRDSTVELLTRTAREGLYDELQGTDTAWSLGFALRCVLSGRHASQRAFGHGGSQSSWAFADPEHGLAVACLCNGKPGPKAHYERVGQVSSMVYEDLGLVSASVSTFKLPMGMGTF